MRSSTTGPSAPTLTLRECDGADLRLFDRFFLAAELHRRIHLHTDAAVSGLLELFAEIFDCDDGRVTGWMDIRGFEHELLLRLRCVRSKRGCYNEQAGSDQLGVDLHGGRVLPRFIFIGEMGQRGTSAVRDLRRLIR